MPTYQRHAMPFMKRTQQADRHPICHGLLAIHRSHRAVLTTALRICGFLAMMRTTWSTTSCPRDPSTSSTAVLRPGCRKRWIRLVKHRHPPHPRPSARVRAWRTRTMEAPTARHSTRKSTFNPPVSSSPNATTLTYDNLFAVLAVDTGQHPRDVVHPRRVRRIVQVAVLDIG